MIALIYKLIVGSFHQHEWDEGEFVRHFTDASKARPSGISRVCRCKKCGEWKTFDLF